MKLSGVGIHVVPEKHLEEVAARLLEKPREAKAGEALLLELESELKTLAWTVGASRAEAFGKILEEASRRRAEITRSSVESLERRLFGELPAAVVQTDIDGRFTVEASASDWLLARSERQTGSLMESYLWVMPIRKVSQTPVISDDRCLRADVALAWVLALVGTRGETSAAADTELVGWVERQRGAAKQIANQAAIEAKATAESVWARLTRGRRFAPGEGVFLWLPVRWIPAGRYTMGSPRREKDRGLNEVQHQVVLTRGFFMAETECTQGQWEAVMRKNLSIFKGVDRPAEEVSWYEAVEYCQKLTTMQRAEGILPEGWEWRLPTEAEWEYAARAGTTGARYGELDAIAWHRGNSGNETRPVKQKAANEWGLHDMLGNVLEWCSDWSGDYPSRNVRAPKGPKSGSLRIVRGGRWDSVAESLRSASRGSGIPGDRFFMGFRPVLSAVR